MFTAYINRIRIFVLSVLLLLGFNMVNAQEEDLGTEVVNVVKPYTPSVSDAFKIKATPQLDDSVSLKKKPVDYAIFSVPVASTFTPAKGQAATVEKAEPEKRYDNYATLGFGNYTTILGELYSNFQISRTDQAGFFLRHNSAWGDIEDTPLENGYSKTSLTGNYDSRQRDMSYGVRGGIEHQTVNWYGLGQDVIMGSPDRLGLIDPAQTYFTASVDGNISMKDMVFQRANASLRFTSDAFSSSEFNALLQGRFLFPVEDFDISLEGELDFLSGGFDRDYFNTTSLDYTYLITGLTPAFEYTEGDLSVSLGAGIYLGLDTQRSNTDFFIYPRIEASYRLSGDQLIAFGGADGGLRQNSFYQFKEENPFVAPTLWIAPTNEQYDVFAGLKGNVDNDLSYQFKLSYSRAEDQAFFLLNPIKEVVVSGGLEGYEYGNSFQVIYDELRTLEVFGSFQYAISDGFVLGASGAYFNYDLQNQPAAWNLPEIQANLFANFDITESFYGGLSLFFVGERDDLLDNLTDPLIPPMQVTLDSFFDANAHVGYRVNDRLNVFLKGSNLLGKNYERWLNFPVQGIQGLLGATYQFDW